MLDKSEFVPGVSERAGKVHATLYGKGLTFEAKWWEIGFRPRR